MTSSDNRTVLLARPGDVRQRLQDALAAAGVELVQVADPIDADIDAVIALAPRNVMIVIDADVEDVFERFEALLASDAHRVLIEEAAVVAMRAGWDVARWSRHLAAKLLGHGNVLPEGFEPDDDAPANKTGDSAETVADAVMPADTLQLAPLDEPSPPATAAQAGPAPLDAPSAFTTPPDLPGSTPADEMQAVIDASADALELAPFGDADVSPADVLTAVDIHQAAPDASQWNLYQDFEARSDIPAANLDEDIVSGYAGALAADADQELAPEEAYQRISEDMQAFDTGADGDRWQDFERPAPEAEPVTPATDTEPAEHIAGLHESWSLQDTAETDAETAQQTDNVRMQAIEASIASLSLVDQDTAASGETTASAASQARVSTDGMVLILGGLGGPDPLRQILQQLPAAFPAPLLVQQALDGGHYDRLVRQIARSSQLPVVLAEAGMGIEDSHVYVLPHGVGIQQSGAGEWVFIASPARGFANVLPALPAIASAAVVLSGASEDNVEALLRFHQSGGQVLAQASEGCYDHSLPGLMASRGAKMDQPAGLVTRLNLLWPSMEPK